MAFMLYSVYFMILHSSQFSFGFIYLFVNCWSFTVCSDYEIDQLNEFVMLLDLRRVQKKSILYFMLRWLHVK